MDGEESFKIYVARGHDGRGDRWRVEGVHERADGSSVRHDPEGPFASAGDAAAAAPAYAEALGWRRYTVSEGR